MIYLKKEMFGQTQRVVKITDEVSVHIQKSSIELDEAEILDEKWYRNNGYVDATREEFDEMLKGVAETINKITNK